MSFDELYKTWLVIEDLKEYLRNQIESGAEGTDRSWNSAVEVQDMLKKEMAKIRKGK